MLFSTVYPNVTPYAKLFFNHLVKIYFIDPKNFFIEVAFCWESLILKKS
jgi:hypothetical protein